MGKAGSWACKVAKFVNTATYAVSMLKSTYVIGNVIKDNIERYLINGEEFSWLQFGADLLTIGLEVFAFRSAAKGLADAQSQSWCFVAGTLVATETGYRAIEEIEAGDTVLAENPETGEVAYKKVLETYENETTELVHVHVNGETISATPTHPFYVNQFGWTRAADLRAGDVLVLSNGEYVVVEFIQHEILESPVKVYNFEVEDFHTYFVGESSVLVHNGCGIDENADTVVANNSTNSSRTAILAQNRVNGRNYEIQKISELKKSANEVQEQITIVTNNGTRFRIDGIGLDSNNKLILQEYKSSRTAPLTNNQEKGFEELVQVGGVVVGKGKGIFSKGYEIPVGTTVEIIRKND